MSASVTGHLNGVGTEDYRIKARVYHHTEGPQLSAPYHIAISTSYVLGR